MVELLIKTLVVLFAPEMGSSEETRVESTGTGGGTVDLSSLRWRVVAIQSDVTTSLAWGPSNGSSPSASLTADQGGVRLPSGVIGMHLVTDRAAKLGHVGDATGSLWIAPLTRRLPSPLTRLLERASR